MCAYRAVGAMKMKARNEGEAEVIQEAQQEERDRIIAEIERRLDGSALMLRDSKTQLEMTNWRSRIDELLDLKYWLNG